MAELREAAGELGLGPGEPGASDPKAVAALFQRVRGGPTLRRICELAGRFRRVAQSKQRLKATHGLDDVVGIEPGGEVGRLLPAELARLVVPELELDALRRIAERQAMCREHHAVEPAGKGPLIVALDESGSMEGAKVHTAQALALALAWVARRQRRWCALVAYSGDSGERLLALPPGRWDESKLADWLAVREALAEIRNQSELWATPPGPVPAAPPGPGLPTRWKARLAGWRLRVWDATRPAARRGAAWCRTTRPAVARASGLVLAVWAYRRLAGLDLAAGLASLAVGCVTPPGVAAALGGGLAAVSVRVLVGVYRAVGRLPGGSPR